VLKPARKGIINKFENDENIRGFFSAHGLFSATIHQQLTQEEQLAAGGKPNSLRVSVGLEHIDNIIEDFRQALEKV